MRNTVLLLITLFAFGWSRPYDNYIRTVTGNIAEFKKISYTDPEPDNGDRTVTMPDYYQRDKAYGEFPGSGAMYCGPAAVSNSLMWLSDHGFPTLVPSSGDRRHDQHSLISMLGKHGFMNTNQNGSTVQDLCRGVKKYLHMRGFSGKIVSEGMYDASKEFKSDRTIPDYNKIKAFTIGSRAVWLNVGWYRYDPITDTYTKDGGHWITVAGFGTDANGGDFLIVHDPDTRGPANDYIYTEEITSGILINGKDIAPWNASGYRRFNTGPNRFGIIGGAVYLSMNDSGSQNNVASR